MLFDIETKTEHKQGLREIDIMPRRTAALDRIMQVKIAVSHRAIVHREPASRNQIPAVYFIANSAGCDVFGNDALHGRLAEIKGAPRAFPSLQDGDTLVDREAWEKWILYAGNLRAHQVLEIVRARYDTAEPARGLHARANVAHGQVGKDVDDKFGGEVQELRRHGGRPGSS